AAVCQDRWENGWPCGSKSGGPAPPRTVTMRAPLVLMSVRVKPSNIRCTSRCAHIVRAARRSLRRDAGGPGERHGDRRLAGDARVEILRLHDHLLDAELGELLLHGRIAQPFH